MPAAWWLSRFRGERLAGTGSTSCASSDAVNTAHTIYAKKDGRLKMLYLSNKAEPPIANLQRPLQAADGYLYLGMPDEALEELDSIPPTHRRDSAVLRARIDPDLQRLWS